jgi:dienelactone hydrolase
MWAMKEIIRDQGIVATLFRPRCSLKLPIVITLGGGAGGMSEFRAELIASHGMASLALSYFGKEGLPSHLQEIPIEYFEKTIHWLQTHPAIDPERIILWGVSRGAELSLLLGSLFPEKIRAIIAYVPSSVVYGSLIHPEKPAWVYRKEPCLASAPFPLTPSNFTKMKVPPGPVALTPFFLEGMNDASAFAASAIAVEKLKCPLLLISGQEDKMWPSTLFASQIDKRLKEKGSSILCTHHSYMGAGHSITPFSDSIEKGYIHSVEGICFDFGGTVLANKQAGLDAWEKTLDFLKSIL